MALAIVSLAILSPACGPLAPTSLLSSMVTKPATQTTASPEVLPSRTVPQKSSSPIIIPSGAHGTAVPLETQTSLPSDSPDASLVPNATQSQTPLQTSDLLFLSKGILLRWDHITDYIGTLAEGVVDYSVSANGKSITMLRSINVTANGVEQYKLDLLDFETKQIVTLLDQTPKLFHLEISPDARWVKFSYQENPGTLYALQTERATISIASEQPNYSPFEMGTCQPTGEIPCLGMQWSPDSQSLLWGDSQGIWLSTLATREPRLIQNNNVTISDPENETNEIEVTFHSLEWSPAGRFAMLSVAPTSSHVSWQTILDTRTGKMIQVPDSYEIDDRESSVSWLDNGDLLVLHASDPTGQNPPSLNLFGVVPTSNDLLVPIKDFEIREIQSPAKSTSTGHSPVFYLSWPNLIDSRMLILGSNTMEVSINPTLFSFDLEFDKFQSMLELPKGTTDILWSPDGQNALVLGANGQILFLTLPEGSLRDLGSVMSDQAHDFFWLPPVPRF